MKRKHVNWVVFIFWLYTAFLAIGLAIVSFTSQRELHLLINSIHHPITDFFFKYITHLGDGATALLLIPYLLFKYRLKVFYLALATCVYAGVLAQFFKKVVFYDFKRPKGVFEEGILRVIDGVNLHSFYSFPSGHTTSIVALCIFLCFLCKKNRIYQLFLFLLSILVAFSRVYISQHFFEDILAGTFLGMISFGFAYFTVKIFTTKTKAIGKSIWELPHIKKLEIDF